VVVERKNGGVRGWREIPLRTAEHSAGLNAGAGTNLCSIHSRSSAPGARSSCCRSGTRVNEPRVHARLHRASWSETCTDRPGEHCDRAALDAFHPEPARTRVNERVGGMARCGTTEKTRELRADGFFDGSWWRTPELCRWQEGLERRPRGEPNQAPPVASAEGRHVGAERPALGEQTPGAITEAGAA